MKLLPLAAWVPIAALAAAALLATGMMSARRSPEAHVNLLAAEASLALALQLVPRLVPELLDAGPGLYTQPPLDDEGFLISMAGDRVL